MMEVQAAPSLQLFRDCAASTSPRTASGAASPSHQMSTSPLACSVDDISSQVLINNPHPNTLTLPLILILTLTLTLTLILTLTLTSHSSIG